MDLTEYDIINSQISIQVEEIEKQIQFALEKYKNKKCTFNEACALSKIPRKEFKKRLEDSVEKSTNHINAARIKADNDLASCIIYLQKGMFDVKLTDIKKLAYQMLVNHKIENKFKNSRQEVGRSWERPFFERHKHIIPSPINVPMTKEYLFKKMNEYFDTFTEVYAKHNIDSSRIYYLEVSIFPGHIVFVYCANAAGYYMQHPMIILRESDESESLKGNLELSEKCCITTSSSGQFTQELFATWLENFIASIQVTPNQKIVLYLDENNTKCKYLKSIQLAKDNGIILIQVPIYRSMHLQPLLMTLIKSMNHQYNEDIKDWCFANSQISIPLKNSIDCLLKAYEDTTTIQSVADGFRNSGIWPLNKSLFFNSFIGLMDDDQLKETEDLFEEPESAFDELENRSLSGSSNTSTDEESSEFDIDAVTSEKTENSNFQIDASTTNVETVEGETVNRQIEEIEAREVAITTNTELKDSNNSESLENIVKESDKDKEISDFLENADETRNAENLSTSSDISTVRFSRIHCTACDVHIGSAPSQVANMFEHPKLRTLLCSRCYEFYGDGDFEQGDDQTDMFCRWCANGGNLYCCSFCSNTFCSKCVKRNFDAVIAKKIEDDEKWKCFVCDETDLYSARSLCRAIIQHVQTVCRILQNDKSMTPAEVSEKMNLDEARCCNRKRKRKRRRTGSASEDEDDETYSPLLSEMPQVKRRRTRKSGLHTNIHTNGSVNNRSDDESSLLAGENDLLPSMIPCEQTMTEGETALPFGTPTKTSAPTVIPITSTERVKTPHVYTNNSKITPTPTLNLLKPMKVRRLTPIGPLSHIQPRPMLIGPLPQTLPKLTTISGTPSHTQPKSMIVKKRTIRPMVSIPQSRTQPQPPSQGQQKHARVLLPKPRPANVSGTPNIIDLESDSDEAVEVIGETEKSARKKNAQQSLDEVKQNEIVSKNFEQLVLNQKHDIDSELQTLRRKFNIILSESPNKSIQPATCGEASLKMKQFQQVMRKTLYRLAQINDRVVREYQGWRKQTTPQTNDTERTKIDYFPTKIPDISLDMKCVRDSESEGEEDEDDTEVDGYILDASNLEANQLNCYNNLTLFRRKRTVEQGVGDYSLKKEDKSIQVYDVRTRDFEKSIGYSLLMKAEYDPKTEKEVLKPVEVLNEHFGKFQEQYIFHLQYIEENGIKTSEDLENLPDPNETPLKDLIEANSPFIAEMLENIPPTVINGSAMELDTSVQDADLETSVQNADLETSVDDADLEANINCLEEIREDTHADSTTATSKAVEELVKMVTKLSDELKSSNNSPENTALSSIVERPDENEEIIKKKNSKKRDKEKDEETVLAVRTLIEEENSSDNNFNKSQTETSAIEGCNFLN